LGDVGTSTESDTLIGEAEDVGVGDSDFATQYKTGAGTSIGWTATVPSGFWVIAAVSIKPINVQQPIASLWPILVAG